MLSCIKNVPECESDIILEAQNDYRNKMSHDNECISLSSVGRFIVMLQSE